VQVRHNRVAREFSRICQRAQLNPKLERGAEHRDPTRPADVLLSNFQGGSDVALDFTVVSPLKDDVLIGAVGAEEPNMYAVNEAEEMKHKNNDPKCDVLGWKCVPMAIDMYGVWGREAQEIIKQVSQQFAVHTNTHITLAQTAIYNVLGLTLARANAAALIAKRPVEPAVGGPEVLNVARVPLDAIIVQSRESVFVSDDVQVDDEFAALPNGVADLVLDDGDVVMRPIQSAPSSSSFSFPPSSPFSFSFNMSDFFEPNGGA